MELKKYAKHALASALIAGTSFAALPVHAADVTLKLHQFLPPMATVPKLVLKPWAADVEKASGGEIKIDHYDAMALGGRPPELMDQATDGIVDLAMTVLGYTPGRFPRSEVFDLPFLSSDPVVTSLAFWDLVESELVNNEFKNIKPLGAWVHGPGVIHTKKPVKSLDDIKGMKIRAPSRTMNNFLKELGAVPVGMPLPGIPEALSKGVISGTVIPWEVTTAVKLPELVGNHTEFSNSEKALYTTPIVLVMNKAKYESLSASQKKAIDDVSGAKLSEMAARVMWERDAPARAIAEKHGNSMHVLSSEEITRWKAASEPVVKRWLKGMAKRDIDGQALIDSVTASIKSHEK